MSLELVVLGCSGSGPAPDTPASGYLVRSSTTAVWLDAGTGTFMELAKHLDPASVDAVAISHLHADHSVDFLGFFHYIAYRKSAVRRIPVFLPPGAIERFAAYLGAGSDHAFFHVFELEEIGERASRSVGDLELRLAPADHSVPANSIRIDGAGRSLTYSGDTGIGGDVVYLASGADVLLCEAGTAPHMSAGQSPHHLTGSEAGRIAADAGVGRLILTHLAPTLTPQEIRNAASAEFPGPIEVASPGMRVAV